jgi:hypothetical protein
VGFSAAQQKAVFIQGLASLDCDCEVYLCGDSCGFKIGRKKVASEHGHAVVNPLELCRQIRPEMVMGIHPRRA